MEQLTIEKPIRLIELFAGIGSQAMALRNIGANFEKYLICEWWVQAFASYKAIHFADDQTDYSEEKTKEELISILHELGISNDGKEPMKLEQIQKKPEKWLRETYNNIRATKNIVNIVAGLMAVGAVNNDADGSVLGNDTTPMVPTAETAYDMLVDLGTDLTEKNVPTQGRWVVVPAWFHGLLLKDKRFVGNGTDYNKALIEGGEVGVAAGFQVSLSNNVPNTTGTKYKIIAGTNRAASFAEQILKTEAYRPEKRFSDAVKGLHVYGAKVTQGKALSVLTANRK